MATHSSAGITQLLERWSKGEEEARDELMPLVYDELHRLAVTYLRRERREHTLQPTELVNELFLKFSEQRTMSWQNRAQFFGVAAQLMRRILVDYARAHYASERGGDRYHLSLKNITAFGRQPDADLLELHDVLKGLEKIDLDQARIVELRFFGGLTIKETAEVMQTSHATIEREWKLAKAYLKRELLRVRPKNIESEASYALPAKRLQDAYAEDEEGYSLKDQLARLDVPGLQHVIEEEAVARRYVAARYQTLIDRKYEHGLSPSENEELSGLKAVLDEMDEPYYDAIIKRLGKLVEERGV